MATIGLLLSVIEAELSTLENNLVNNARLKGVRRLRIALGDVLGREVPVPEPAKPLAEPSKEFWKALEEPSAEEADGAVASKDDSAVEAPKRSKTNK